MESPRMLVEERDEPRAERRLPEPGLLVGTSYRWASAPDADPPPPPRWLQDYCRRFRLLELAGTFDTLPSPDALRAWVDATPPGFVFDVQAFRLLCRRAADRATIPRDLLSELRTDAPRVTLSDLSGAAQYTVWERFRHALEPLRTAGRLGFVIFRLPRSLKPGLEAGAYIESLTERLPTHRIAVELTASEWGPLDDDDLTIGVLRTLGIAFVDLRDSIDADVREWDRGGLVRVRAAGTRLGSDDARETTGAWTERLHALSETAPPGHLIVFGSRRLARAAATRLAPRPAGSVALAERPDSAIG